MNISKKPFRINAKYLFLVFLFMLGLSFASVPLYDLFCRVTGFGGTPQIAEKPADKILDQSVKVRFNANVNGNLPFYFKPKNNFSNIKIGEVGTIDFRVENQGNEDLNIISTFNTSPPVVGKYFQKLQCFCFQKQLLKAGEMRDFKVAYYIDPKIVDDPATKMTKEITLSYSLFEVKKAN